MHLIVITRGKDHEFDGKRIQHEITDGTPTRQSLNVTRRLHRATKGKAGPLHDWLTAGDSPSRQADGCKMSKRSRQFFDGLVDRLGATIAGRRTYDDSNGWGGKLPFDWPFFIVTHHPPVNAADLPFRFVTEGVERAVQLAKKAPATRTSA